MPAFSSEAKDCNGNALGEAYRVENITTEKHFISYCFCV